MNVATKRQRIAAHLDKARTLVDTIEDETVERVWEALQEFETIRKRQERVTGKELQALLARAFYSHGDNIGKKISDSRND